MHIGTIVVCVGSSTVLAIRSFGWQYNASNGVVFRRQIGTESCHRLVGLQGISVTTVIGFVAAANTGSSSFVLIALPYFAVFCCILLAIIFCLILPAIFCLILPSIFC